MEVQIEQGEEWREANDQIREYRDASTQGIDPAAAQLHEAVSHEVSWYTRCAPTTFRVRSSAPSP
jgi:hypothetical protein